MDTETSQTSQIWTEHYRRGRANLLIPDENAVRFFARHEKGRLLDFGCGSGRNGIWALQNGWQTSFCDYSSEAVKLCRQNLADLNLEAEVFTSTDKLPLEENSFDSVLAWGVFHYNPPEVARQSVAEIIRILKPGGTLCTSVRSERDTHLGVAENRVAADDIKEAYCRLFSRDDLLQLLSPFGSVKLGTTERTPVGEEERRISHFIAWATK